MLRLLLINTGIILANIGYGVLSSRLSSAHRSVRCSTTRFCSTGMRAALIKCEYYPVLFHVHILMSCLIQECKGTQRTAEGGRGCYIVVARSGPDALACIFNVILTLYLITAQCQPIRTNFVNLERPMPEA